MEGHEGTLRSYVGRDLILIWGNISSQIASSTYGTRLTTELLHLLLWTVSKMDWKDCKIPKRWVCYGHLWPKTLEAQPAPLLVKPHWWVTSCQIENLPLTETLNCLLPVNSSRDQLVTRSTCHNSIVNSSHHQIYKTVHYKWDFWNMTIATRMWANAQRDGRHAEYRWRPLFNAAKFAWRPLLECRAVSLPRRESHWN